MSNSTLYTKDYFLSDCEGFKQFLSSGGRVLSPRLNKVFTLAQIQPGMTVLDVGSGRGELILHSALRGARSMGVDLSSDGLALANDSLKSSRRDSLLVKGCSCFVRGDASLLPVKPGSVDVVFLSDIVEHFPNRVLEKSLRSIFYVLRPGGRIILHTSPNRIFIKYGLFLYSIIGKIYGKKIPWRLRNHLPPGLQKPVHVNEQTVGSLKRTLRRAGFVFVNLWTEKNPHYIYYFLKDDCFVKRINTLYKLFPVQQLFFSDIFGIIAKT